MIHQGLHLGSTQVLLQVERDRVFSVGMSLHDPFPAQTRATHTTRMDDFQVSTEHKTAHSICSQS